MSFRERKGRINLVKARPEVHGGQGKRRIRAEEHQDPSQPFFRGYSGACRDIHCTGRDKELTIRSSALHRNIGHGPRYIEMNGKTRNFI